MADKPTKPRISLTKAQVQAGVGAELFALCQSMTADGILSKEEIVELRNWLQDNAGSDVPAVAFLSATLQRILADGKVTKEERQELYKAIESILPPEARKEAVSHRKVVEARVIASEFAKREAEQRQVQQDRDRIKEENQRNSPIASGDFMVAGVHFEGRPDVIRRHVNEGDDVVLFRDPTNRFSKSAIGIRLLNGMHIGFVPEDDAVDLAPLFDQGCLHQAFVKKVLDGGRVPVPVVKVHLYRQDAEIVARPSLALPQSSIVRTTTMQDPVTKSGCFSLLLVLLVLALLVGIVLT